MISTIVWGTGNVGRLAIRAVEAHPGLKLTAVLVNNPDKTVTTKAMGEFEAGTQGALRFEVHGVIEGEPRIIIEHVTRIHPSCAPDWPMSPSGDGANRVIIEGDPRIEVSVEATDELAGLRPAQPCAGTRHGVQAPQPVT